MTVIATGGGITKTLPLVITINVAPTFTLTPYTSSITIVPGIATQTTVIAAGNSTFASAITLSATWPAGVQASFSPSTLPVPGNGAASITFSVTSSVKPGTYAVIITGTGGGLTKTATIQLNVQPAPAFALALDKQFINVSPGTSLPIKMSLVGTSGGFNTPITLLVAGSQTGIGVNFAPSTLTLVNPTSTVTISVAGNARPGIYTIALAGTTNKASQTLLLSVTIPQSGQTKR
jgi:hypothetical protein